MEHYEKNNAWVQVFYQKFFRTRGGRGVGEVCKATSIKILLQTSEKETPQGNILTFFLLDTLKTTFWMENLTQRWRQTGPIFQKAELWRVTNVFDYGSKRFNNASICLNVP